MEKKTTLLITGAAASIGFRAVELALQETPHRIVAGLLSTDSTADLEKLEVEIRVGDLGKQEDCESLVKGIDFLIHCGTRFDLSLSRQELMQANHQSTENLARAAADAKVKHFLLTSSTDVYGPQERMPVGEEVTCRPENDYGFSMGRAEQGLLRIGNETGMAVTILRPSIVYGPGGMHWTGTLCALTFLIHDLIGFAPRFTGGPLQNAVHIDDVVGAALHLIGQESSFNEDFNVSDNDWLPLGEFIEKLWEPAGAKWRLRLPMLKLPVKVTAALGNALMPELAFDVINGTMQKRWERLAKRYGLASSLTPRFDRGHFSYGMSDNVFDNTKLKNIGYALRYPNFDRGFQRTVDWYKENKWLPEAVKRGW